MVLKTFSYAAEDSLTAFQKEIIGAKEKRETISGKTGSVGATLDKERAALLKKQANDLMEELTRAGYSSTSEAPQEVKAIAAIAVPPKQSLKVKKPEKVNPNPLAMLDFGFWKKSGREMTPGESIYKVAVSDDKITVTEAVDIGLANSPQAVASKKKVEVAQGKLNEAKRAMYPTIQGVYEEGGGKAPTSFRTYETRSYKVNFNQPIYYGGELVLTVKQAEENVKSAKADYEKARNELIHQIRIAYYGAVKGEYNIQYQRDLFERVASVYQRLKTERSHKVISEVDYLNAESQYQEVYFQNETAKTDELAAQLALRQALSMDGMEPLPIDLELKLDKIKPDFQTILNLSFQNNPDLRLKWAAYQSAQYGRDVFHAKKKPRFDLRGSYGKLGEQFSDEDALVDPAEDKLAPQKEWFVGIHGSMPIGASTVEYDHVKNVFAPTITSFAGGGRGSESYRDTFKYNFLDGLANVTDEAEAEAVVFQAEADYRKAQDELLAKLREDFYELQKSLIQIDSSAAKIRYQEKQNSIMEYLLSLQETPASNYFEGLLDHSQNKFAFIQAVSDYQIAKSSLSISIGDPYYFEPR